MATVARIWRGVIRTEDRDAYAAYLAETGIKEYRQTPGNQGAYILTRDLGDGRTEIPPSASGRRLDSIRAFAGDDISLAVFYPEDDRYLLERDLTVTHYEVPALDE